MVKCASFNLYYAHKVVSLTYIRNNLVLIERKALRMNYEKEQRSDEVSGAKGSRVVGKKLGTGCPDVATGQKLGTVCPC